MKAWLNRKIVKRVGGLTMNTVSVGAVFQRSRQCGPVHLLPAHHPPLERDRLLPLLRHVWWR